LERQLQVTTRIDPPTSNATVFDVDKGSGLDVAASKREVLNIFLSVGNVHPNAVGAFLEVMAYDVNRDTAGERDEVKINGLTLGLLNEGSNIWCVCCCEAYANIF
jgi:hypothetical protein